MWTFKMFFKDDGEFFEYDPLGMQGAAGTEKALPYLKSLLSFLELDSADWEPLVLQAFSGLAQFFSAPKPAHADHMMQPANKSQAPRVTFLEKFLKRSFT